METFYDGDLKDIWDSDLDPTESLKISTDTDMHDCWFLERDIKDPTVILNDKLISDALLNGMLPIKSEHSYSLNSDGDSLPNSPRSLQTKMDDMEDECYPAISLKTATSNLRHHEDSPASPLPSSCSSAVTGSLLDSNSTHAPVATSTSVANSFVTTSPACTLTSISSTNNNSLGSLPFHSSSSGTGIYANLNKITSAPMTFNLRSLETNGASSASTSGVTTISLAKQCVTPQHQQQIHLHLDGNQTYLPHEMSIMSAEHECSSPASSRDGSTSPDTYSDIEIDESCIKDEPMSPESSCPPSPSSMAARGTNGSLLSLSMANMAAYTNSDLVFEHKNGCLQLTPASQNLLKSQQLILGTNNNSNIIIPKFVKTTKPVGTFVTNNGSTPHKTNSSTYGLPLTPPSSLPSDESEGNLTPEHLLSPHSPHTTITVTGNVGTAVRRNTSSSSCSSSSTSSNCISNSRNIAANNAAGNNNSTRQPIHTPLISSQPKGSTGTLILTEEEKRTLLAEGYPIPQKLPLTKAEEKSLKKIRRKIKNKISAQESRRKKKEYMDQLERKVEILVNENSDYRKQVDSLESTNANLLSQLQKLQALTNRLQNSRK